MPRRGLISVVLLCVLALTAAACGGGDDPPVVDDTTPLPQDSGDDREVPATEDQPESPTIRNTPDTIPAVATAGEQAETTQAEERPSAGGGTTVEAGDNGTTPATTTSGTYTVQAGDTLGDIAFRFGTSAAALADLNNLDNPNSLQIGQVLVLPGGSLPDEEDDETPAPGDGNGDAPEGDSDAPEGDDEAADPPPAPVAGAGLSPGGIPQPGPEVTADAIPDRPASLGEYATTALPWLQDRTTPSELQDLFIQWSMPPVSRGDRFFLVDTDADGLFSLIAIFTDPGQAQNGPLTDANIVIYDPIPDQPTRWRQAFDHNLAKGGVVGQDYFLLEVDDVTGDGEKDITYAEVFCGANTCTTVVHVLVRDGDGYRDAAVGIDVATATSFTFEDVTGDGVLDLTIEGGTFGSVGAGPPRPFVFVYSASGNAFVEIARRGLPTDVLVWVVADGNTAFDGADYGSALALYQQAATDPSLDEFIPGAGPDLIALAQLRSAIAQLQLGDPTAAAASAQAASAAPGLIGELATAYFGAIVAQPDTVAGCAALNDALALRGADWDAFWGQFGFGLPAFRAEQLCPF